MRRAFATAALLLLSAVPAESASFSADCYTAALRGTLTNAVRPPRLPIRSLLEIPGTPVLSTAKLTVKSNPRFKTLGLNSLFVGEERGKYVQLPGLEQLLMYFEVKYLRDSAREAYRVIIRDGKVYNSAGVPIIGPGKKYFFVMDQAGNFYLSDQTYLRGSFHHSSFLAGEPVAAAGELTIADGRIRGEINPNSGHYLTPDWALSQALSELAADGVDEAGLEIKWVADLTH